MNALPRTGPPSSTASLHPLQAAGAFALFAWLTPTHELPWTTFHAEFAMALAAMLAGACVLWRDRHQAVAIPASALATLAVALVPLLQLATGKIAFRGDAVLVCMYLAGFALAQLIGARAVAIWGLARMLEAFAWLLLIGAVISTWLALCQWQQLDYLGLALVDLPQGSRPFANFNQPNLLATLLVLGLLATAILYDAERFGNGVALLLTGLLGFALAATQSRAGLLGLAVVGALLLLRHHQLTRRMNWREVVVGLATVLIALLAWQAVRTISLEAGGRDASAMVAAGTRNIHWPSMWDAIGRRPWTGYGWNQVDAAQFAVAPDHPATGEVLAYGHNLVLDLLLWNGVPLGIVLVGGLALWFSLALREARNSTALLALALVVAAFAHAMVEYPLYYAYFLLPIGLMIGGGSVGGGDGLTRGG